MRKKQIFIGDIRKCTKYGLYPVYLKEDSVSGITYDRFEEESELYKKNAILIKISEGDMASSRYIDLENVNSALDMLRLKNSNLIMSGSPKCVDELFVDTMSLKHYYDKGFRKKTSVKQLKKEKQK